MTIKNVALIGANGTLGPSILRALVSATSFNITVLSRKSSKSTYPSSIHEIRISDSLPIEELTTALLRQDAIIATFAGANDDLQIRLADAAAAAGVKRFIPADFGSCDSSSPRALELMPLYVAKTKVREHLQELASDGKLTWTSLVCGHFFDFGLETGLLSFNVKGRKVKIFDDGEIRWSATTLATIGTAVVRVLQKEEETRNRMLYIQSFCVTQNEVLRSLMKMTGKDWQIERVSSDGFIKEIKKETDRNPKNDEARKALVGVVGILESNWEGKKDFANSLLGLENEDLDQVVKEVVSR
jgi:putative NADH-flavin reductase